MKCEHLIMSKCGKVCDAPAKFRAKFPDGKIMLVCGRHGNSIAVAYPSGRVLIDNLSSETPEPR